jgi:hypothetical protein
MNVKSDFLNDIIQEEVYVRQSLGFENPKYSDRLYNLLKTLYELKQAPRAWYASFKMFLLEHGYAMGSVDNIIFTLNHDTDFLFKFTLMILSLVALLTLVYPDFRK